MKKLKAAITGIFGYGVIFLTSAAVVVGLSSLGGTIMRFFGFTFTSGWKAVQFFVLSGIFGYPLEILAKAFPRAMLDLHVLGLTGARILFLVLDVATTMLVMSLVDYCMPSVSATSLSMLVIAVLMSVSDLKEIRPRGEREKE